VIENILDFQEEMIEWRHYLHRYPETAYNEKMTSEYIAGLLDSFGLKVHKGLAKTGIVSSLKVGRNEKKIGLRADMDALDIYEQNELSYKSLNNGKMHACGHDGHSAMLLGAAKYLSETQQFDGTVYFIFQPAEEIKAGGKKMIDDGLFKLFPAESIYGMHNMPRMPAGHFAVKAGSMMASMDTFEINILGDGGHAALPHLSKDPFIASSHIINAIQTIVNRTTDPFDSAVVSLTQIHGGNTWNTIPESVTLRGTFRSFNPMVKSKIESRINQIASSICNGFGVKTIVKFNPENPAYPVTINTDEESKLSTKVAIEIVGEKNVDLNPISCMASEDFSFMLQERPGCYVWIGNGSTEQFGDLHNPNYNFNDEVLHIGASYWVKLVETILHRD